MLALRISTWTNSDFSPSLAAKDSPFSLAKWATDKWHIISERTDKDTLLVQTSEELVSRVGYRFLSPTRMLRSGRSLESAVAVEPQTRPAPPSTSTRALLEGFLLAASADGAVGAAAGGAHALTTPMVAIPVGLSPRGLRATALAEGC